MPDFGIKTARKKAVEDPVKVSNEKEAYRAPAQDLSGYRTLVNLKSQKGILPSDTETPGQGQSNLDAVFPVEKSQTREKERVLPLPSDHDKKRDKKIGPTYFNKNREYPVRTLPVPGEQYGHPTKFDYNYVRRRDGVTALDEDELEDVDERLARNPLPRPNQRQKNLPSNYSRVMRQWYRRKRNRKNREQKRRYRTKGKRDPQAKKYRKFYNKYPNRYKRRGRSPFNSPAERTQAWRDDQKREERQTGLSQEELKRRRERRPSETLRTRSPVRRAFDQAERLATVLEYFAAHWPAEWGTVLKKTQPPDTLDQNFAPFSPGSSVPRKDRQTQEGESLKAPDLSSKPQKGLKWKVKPPAKGKGYPVRTVNNPSSGSGKVIPLAWYTDFVNNTQAVPDGVPRYLHNTRDVKVAATMAEILSRCDSKIKERAKEYTPKLARTDTKNWIWHWKVGKHTVRVQAFKRGRAKSLPKLHLKVSCSCPYWRWWGPAHWATREEYQKGTAPGTASYPKIRDPAHWRPICKHAYAVLQQSQEFFVRPSKHPLKKLGTRFSPDRNDAIEVEMNPVSRVERVMRAYEERQMIRRIVRRYVDGEES